MALKLVDSPKAILSFWTVKFHLIIGALMGAAGVAWTALTQPQRDALLAVVGITPESQSAIVAALMFGGTFVSAATVALRAIAQQPADPAEAETQPMDPPAGAQQ